MIKKLKLRFIILSMTTLLVLLSVIVTGMNVISYSAIADEADEVVSIISENKGSFPEPKKKDDQPVPKHMSPEIPYESRYFWVLIDSYDNIVQVETSRIASVSTSDAIEFSRQARAESRDSGFTGNYRYNIFQENENIRISFLDCRRDLEGFRSFVTASIGMSVIGYIVVFFVILFFSGRIVRPVAESYSKQKRFITDAGHEIKTPLTIINANADVLEMEVGENECINDIRDQALKLSDLTNELIYLARMEEGWDPVSMAELNLSELAEKVIHAFNAPAQMKKIEFYCNIHPELIMKCEQKAMEHLFMILLDNAIKYSPEESIISVDFRREGKLFNLHIVNAASDRIDSSELGHIFDRFYRPDLSRNAETGGHGIGLSVAKVIVNSHKGKIHAWTPDEKAFHITVTLPAGI